jgi:CubicO group peptidase (beta-lactamase class C family)
MKDTAFYVPAEKQKRFAALLRYDDTSKTLTAPAQDPLAFDYSKPPGVASGGAGLVSTTLDYARFAQMLLNGGELDGVRILSPQTVKLLASNHMSDVIRNKPDAQFGAATGWGFGVDVAVEMDQAKGGTLSGVGSYDWGGAAGTWFWIDPANDLIFIGMIQVMNRWAHPTLINIDKDSVTFVYSALLQPER